MTDQKEERMTDYVISVNGPMTSEKAKDLNEVMHAAQDAYVVHVEKIANSLGISSEAALHIMYLRSRSRWTQEKEDYLIRLDREGKPFPNMMDDFEVPK